MDETVKKRLARIYELNTLATKGPLTAAQKTELKKLQDEQTNWEIYNPGLKGAVSSYQESLKAPATQLGNEKLLKKDLEEKATADDIAARESAAAAAAASRAAVKAPEIRGRTRSAPIPEEPVIEYLPDGTPVEVNAGGRGYQVLPKPKEATPAVEPAVKTDLEADDYAWGEPYKEQEKATGGTPQVHHEVPAKDDMPEQKPFNKPIDWDKLRGIGLGALDVIEAIGKYRGKIDKPTTLEKRFQEQLEEQQRKYMADLEEKRAQEDEKRARARMEDQQAWEATQNYLDRQAAAARAGAAAAGGVSAGLIPD